MIPRKLSEKETAELAFWESRVRLQGVLTNDHFEYFYTTHFGLLMSDTGFCPSN